ncbi:lysophospholipid acyltransferase family protein [Gilvibacter sediminis]|uniref:lysophospholipid acyltransferase family protein n=1 Tax=Gilvibacter sediminis TaxID=379071 RepID=UPI0023504EDD|nr:lysophospholipid acyltransferase family protein [Gilvibacter sediminis]MDC7999102.1 lysophospholipid acyltransferase family protein [Gilvibacter sediminis]
MRKAVYFLVKSLVWAISKLPFWALYALADFLFLLTYYLIGYRKKVVYYNLQLAFPDWDETKIKKTRKAFYRHFCDFVLETIKSYTISQEQAEKRFVYKNVEILKPVFNNNRSVLLWCGHYASWEWSGILQKSIPVQGYAVYKKLEDPSFDAMVRKIRGRFGGIIVNNKQIVSTLFRNKKEGIASMTLMLSDQTPRPTVAKHWEPFMGIEVPVFTGGEELGRRLDLVHLYLHVEKVKRGYYEATLVPLHPAEANEYPITRSFLNALESQIKQAPEFYLWSHKRWKYRKEA